MNFSVASIMIVLAKYNIRVLSIQKGEIVLLNPKDNQLNPIKRPELKSVKEILNSQNMSFEFLDNDTPLVQFCKERKIKLPTHSLNSVKIGSLIFDAVWNDGWNRLNVLHTLPTKGNASALEGDRTISEWISRRNENNQMYDKTVFVFCPTSADKEHVKEESRKCKANVLNSCAFINGCKLTNKSGEEKNHEYRKLIDELKELFSEEICFEKAKDSRKVFSDTLVVVLPPDTLNTLNIIASSIGKIKNVMLCHTNNDEMIKLAKSAKEYLENSYIGLSVNLMQIDYSGSTLVNKLKFDENATNVHVNISPGTKAQAAFLTYWAVKNNCSIWSVSSPYIKCLSDKTQKDIEIQAVDPVVCLKINYGDKVIVEGSAHDNEETKYNHLLTHLSLCINPNELDFRSDFTSQTEASVLTKQKNKLKLSLKQNNEEFSFDVQDGEWFELLVAHALKTAGIKNVSARVRTKFNDDLQEIYENHFKEEIHRQDIDVIGTYKSHSYLISCKAMTYKSKGTAKVRKVANEACSMAGSIARFTIPLLCYINKNQHESVEAENSEQVKIIDLNDLCNKEKIIEIFLEIANKKRSTISPKQ